MLQSKLERLKDYTDAAERVRQSDPLGDNATPEECLKWTNKIARWWTVNREPRFSGLFILASLERIYDAMIRLHIVRDGTRPSMSHLDYKFIEKVECKRADCPSFLYNHEAVAAHATFVHDIRIARSSIKKFIKQRDNQK